MVSNDETIYLTKEGYDQRVKHIEELRTRLEKVSANRGQSRDSDMDTLKAPSDLVVIAQEEARLASLIAREQDALRRVKIIERHSDNNLIDIGDIVTVKINSEFGPRVETFKLVCGDGNVTAELMEFSVNSPIGTVVYQNKVGEQGTYTVSNVDFQISILAKETPKEVKSLPPQESRPHKRELKSIVKKTNF